MTEPDQNDRALEVEQLADAIGGENATPEQYARLEALATVSDEACRVYVRRMAETLTLHRRSRQIRLLAWLDGTNDPADISRGLGLQTASRFSAVQHATFTGARRRWILGLSLLAVVGALTWQFAASRPTLVPASAAEIKAQAVAKIIRSVDAAWLLDGARAELKAGDWLLTGRHTLVKGVVQITFPWGTEVTLESPTEIDFTPAGQRRLLSGQLVARVSPEDTGFTIETPTVEVIDLGTEFGVSTAVGGASEVHVFKGSVEARRKQPSSAATNPLRILAGEASAFGHHESPMMPIVFNPRRFSKAWKVSHRVVETLGAIRFVHPQPASVVEGRTESSEDLLLFQESQNVVLSRSVAVTMTQPSLYTSFGNRNVWLPAGIAVDSYLLHFDPRGSAPGQGVVTVEGSVTFDRPVVAVIARGDQLAESDELFAHAGTQYVTSGELTRFEGLNKEFAAHNTLGYLSNHLPTCTNRGLVGLWNCEQRTDSPAPNDWIRLSADRRTVSVKCTAGCEADQVRVLVAAGENDDLPGEIDLAHVSKPFHGQPFQVGQTIEAEDYDLGGDGVGYYDLTPDALANVYRINESPELLRFVHGERVHTAVCQCRAGEWLAYTVEVDRPGWYVIEARVASVFGGGVFRFEFGEAVRTDSLKMPKLLAYQPDTFPADLYGRLESNPVWLNAGQCTMRVVMESHNTRGGTADFDCFRILPSEKDTAAPAVAGQPDEHSTN